MLNRTLKIYLLFFLFSFSFSQVILTEVMYDPDSSNSEFVEPYNTSTTTNVESQQTENAISSLEEE